MTEYVETGWKYFFAEDEGPQDAKPLMAPDWREPNWPFIPAYAAEAACEADWDNHDGWERGTSEEPQFKIGIISPKGEVTFWNAWHEATISHRAEELSR